MDSEPGFLRYFLVGALLVFGGTALAMHFSQPVRVIREAQMAPPPEVQQSQSPERLTVRQSNELMIKNMDSLAGRVQRSMHTRPKVNGT